MLLDTLTCRIIEWLDPIDNNNALIVRELIMSDILNDVLSANRDYVDDFGDKGELPMPPGRNFAILTCMDARLDPANMPD